MNKALLCLGLSVPLTMCGLACGGSSTAPAQTPTTSAPAGSASSAAGSPTNAANGPTNGAAPGGETDAPLDDPNESSTAIRMTPLLSKTTPKASFPKGTTTDHECWKTLSLGGDHEKDFAALVTACGAPTGLAEYTKSATGKLHHKHDKRDTFSLKLAGGLCYRFFAVGDGGIKDIDILIEKPSGALVADDKQDQPVAIIDGDKTWCMDDDADYNFQIEVDGIGKGNYKFGVWARPKGK